MVIFEADKIGHLFYFKMIFNSINYVLFEKKNKDENNLEIIIVLLNANEKKQQPNLKNLSTAD
jgi:hypothetical protein